MCRESGEGSVEKGLTAGTLYVNRNMGGGKILYLMYSFQK
jgi:hypothetical protein